MGTFGANEIPKTTIPILEYVTIRIITTNLRTVRLLAGHRLDSARIIA